MVLHSPMLAKAVHGKDEVVGRCAFERFDDSVLRRPRDHSQPIADNIRRLVMTGIDRDDEFRFLSCGSAFLSPGGMVEVVSFRACPSDRLQFRSRYYFNIVRYRELSSHGVIHRRLDVLD